ncbi:hypothetical protein [Thiomicrorhabdus aquaedulcis]|uniref:hypothetical protein n=1 Tax=Thiomicrorhabdus aquaedulcis TaxID=2211106 RepID=UPI000FD6E173|nr:hypothetical protein [Thiomicrorhabdus aquaedulcis]
MSHKHQAIIEKVFSHPISTSIDWKKLQHALEHFGAQIDISSSNKAKVVLRGEEIVLGLPHHGHELADKADITQLRHFLELVKLTPDTLNA